MVSDQKKVVTASRHSDSAWLSMESYYSFVLSMTSWGNLQVINKKNVFTCGEFLNRHSLSIITNEFKLLYVPAIYSSICCKIVAGSQLYTDFLIGCKIGDIQLF